MKTLAITLIVAFVCLALPQPALASTPQAIEIAVQAQHPGFRLLSKQDGKDFYIALFQKSEIIALAILEEQDGILKIIEWNEHLLPLKQYREEQFLLNFHTEMENRLPTFSYWEEDTGYTLFLSFERQGKRWIVTGGAFTYKDHEKDISFFLSKDREKIIYHKYYPHIRTKKPQSMYLSEFSLPALQKHMQTCLKLLSSFKELGLGEDTCILYEDEEYYEGEE